MFWSKKGVLCVEGAGWLNLGVTKQWIYESTDPRNDGTLMQRGNMQYVLAYGIEYVVIERQN